VAPVTVTPVEPAESEALETGVLIEEIKEEESE